MTALPADKVLCLCGETTGRRTFPEKTGSKLLLLARQAEQRKPQVVGVQTNAWCSGLMQSTLEKAFPTAVNCNYKIYHLFSFE